jgi:hypothetical protein
MPFIDEIRLSIAERLAEIEDQVAALTAALQALDGDDSGRRGRPRATAPEPLLGRDAPRDAGVARSENAAPGPRRSRRRPREVLSADNAARDVSEHAAPGPRRSRRRPREVLSADDATRDVSPADDVEAVVNEDAEGLSAQDETVLTYLRSWPDRPEAERLVAEVDRLSPSALAKLRRFVDQEMDRRREGRRVGFTINRATGTPTRSSRQLIDAGFVRLKDGRLELTDQGRAAGRLFAGRRAATAPAWWTEVLGPLLQPRD